MLNPRLMDFYFDVTPKMVSYIKKPGYKASSFFWGGVILNLHITHENLKHELILNELFTFYDFPHMVLCRYFVF